MNKVSEIRQDLSESNIVFVPSQLDDAWLSVHAFRVYCHLARRTLNSRQKDIYPSASTVAKVCRMNKDSVWRALNELIERGMVRREIRPGTTSRHWLTRPRDWTDHPPARSETGGGGNQGVAENDGHPLAPACSESRGGGNQGVAENDGHPLAESRGHPLAESRGHEGTPIKVLQLRSGECSNEHSPAVCVLANTGATPNTAVQSGPAEKNRAAGKPKPANPVTPRPRNPVFDALAELDGWRPGAALSRTEAGRIAAAMAAIREAWPRLPEGATAEQRCADTGALAAEVRRRAYRYRSEVFPHAALTSTALAAHWSKCQHGAAAGVNGTPPLDKLGPYPRPDGCDYHAVARAHGMYVQSDCPWHEIGFETRAKIIEAFHAQTVP